MFCEDSRFLRCTDACTRVRAICVVLWIIGHSPSCCASVTTYARTLSRRLVAYASTIIVVITTRLFHVGFAGRAQLPHPVRAGRGFSGCWPCLKTQGDGSISGVDDPCIHLVNVTKPSGPLCSTPCLGTRLKIVFISSLRCSCVLQRARRAPYVGHSSVVHAFFCKYLLCLVVSGRDDTAHEGGCSVVFKSLTPSPPPRSATTPS